MQTVNFQCGHCGNLMGVSTEFLGQQVRCPTCQQVVVAPSASGLENPASGDTVATHSPDMGAGLSNTSPLEDSVRTEPVSPFSAAASSSYQPPSTYEDPTLAPGGPRIGAATEPFLPPTTPVSTDPFLANSPAPAASEHVGPTPSWMDSPAPGGSDVPASPAPVRRQRKESMWWVWVMLPLVSYSIFATIIIVWLWNRSSATAPKQNQLELMPDLNGDQPMQNRLNRTFIYPSTLATHELPDKHRIKLGGEAFTIGSLEVKPVSVEKKVVNVFTEGYSRSERCQNPSLVLHLKVTNLSEKFAFAPLDNYFDRQYRKKGEGSPPLTALEMGSNNRFFGGPTPWCPLKRTKDTKDVRREWVEGRKMVDPEVKPGESLDTFVCTDGNDEKLAELLDKYEGPLLWRVHLRCGPTKFQDKLVAATTVIGVEFTDKDYRK
jgi:hypothetical protein